MNSTKEDLERQIEDYYIAQNAVFEGHWLSDYFKSRVEDKIKEYKIFTGLDYGLTKLKDKYKHEVLDRQARQ